MPLVSPIIVGLLAVAGTVVDTPHAARRDTFDPIASVVMHPRCINCHQDQSPRQGDARTDHLPLSISISQSMILGATVRPARAKS